MVCANGVPAETFIDNLSRRQFDNYAEFEALYPSAPMMTELEIPRVLFRRQLSTVTVQRLNALEEVWVARERSMCRSSLPATHQATIGLNNRLKYGVRIRPTSAIKPKKKWGEEPRFDC